MQDDDLVVHLAAALGVDRSEARRVVDDVLAYYREPVEQYVRRRHAECKLRGLHNAQIYPMLVRELDHRLVAPPRLSERQVRRIVYG